MPETGRLNIREIEAFRAAITHGSATAAAGALRLTQPAVSRLLQSFERRVGFRLFERRRYGLAPTPEALLLHEEVARSYAGLDRIAAAAAAIGERRQGRLRVIAQPAYADGRIARLLGAFLVDRPDVTAELEIGGRAAVHDAVVSGRADLGVAILPIEHELVAVEPLARKSLVFAVPASHRLARAPRLRAADLHGESLVILTPANPLRQQFDRALPPDRLRARRVIEARNQRGVLELVAAGAGIGIIDPEVAEHRRGDDVALVAAAPSMTFTLALVMHRRAPVPMLARDFGAWLRLGMAN